MYVQIFAILFPKINAILIGAVTSRIGPRISSLAMLKRKATAATKKTITKKPKPAENGSESGLLKTMPESYDFPGISDNCIKV